MRGEEKGVGDSWRRVEGRGMRCGGGEGEGQKNCNCLSAASSPWAQHKKKEENCVSRSELPGIQFLVRERAHIFSG